MAEKLKIISLGGLNEIGKNLTVYEYGGDIVVVDCGMGFPDDDMYCILLIFGFMRVRVAGAPSPRLNITHAGPARRRSSVHGDTQYGRERSRRMPRRASRERRGPWPPLHQAKRHPVSRRGRAGKQGRPSPGRFAPSRT